MYLSHVKYGEGREERMSRRRSRRNWTFTTFQHYIGYSSHHNHTCIVQTGERKKRQKSNTEIHGISPQPPWFFYVPGVKLRYTGPLNSLYISKQLYNIYLCGICVIGDLRRFQQSFSHISTVASCCMRHDIARIFGGANTDAPCRRHTTRVHHPVTLS